MKKMLLVCLIIAAASATAMADTYTYKEIFLGSRKVGDPVKFYMVEKSETVGNVSGYKAKFYFDLTDIGGGAELYGKNSAGKDTLVYFRPSPERPAHDETGYNPDAGLVLTHAYLDFYITDIGTDGDSDPERIRVNFETGTGSNKKIMTEHLEDEDGAKRFRINLFDDAFRDDVMPELADGRYLAVALAPDFKDVVNSFTLEQVILTVKAADPVPEPATMALLGIGLIGVGILRSRYQR